jgi:hypothetical protein
MVGCAVKRDHRFHRALFTLDPFHGLDSIIALRRLRRKLHGWISGDLGVAGITTTVRQQTQPDRLGGGL